MKILYLTGQLAVQGGVERVLTDKMNYLAENTDNEVYLIVSEQCNRPFVYQLSKRIHIYDLHLPPLDNGSICRNYYIAGMIILLPHLLKVGRAIRRIRPDIIIEPNTFLDYWTLPLIKGKAKIIREVHNSVFESNNGWVSKIDRYIQRKYDKIVLLTQDEAQYLKDTHNICVIPNPIESNAYKSDLHNKCVITIGRITPIKQYNHFIQIASKLAKKHKDWSFKIYGNGDPEYVKSLKGLIDETSFSNRILLCGATNNVPDVMTHASLCVCTSKSESFGLTIAEAMECGLPVVSYDCPNGPRNIISHGEDGYLIQPDNIQEMVDTIDRMMSDSTLLKKLGKAACFNISRYHIENIMVKWQELFEELINKQ